MLKRKTRYKDVIVKKWTSISNYLCTEEKRVQGTFIKIIILDD